MTRVKTAAVLILAIMIYSVCSLFILDNENDKFKARLQEVQRVYESGDTEGALELSNALNEYWHKYEKRVTMLVHDDALTGINVSIAKITPFISNENEELIAERINVSFLSCENISESALSYILYV